MASHHMNSFLRAPRTRSAPVEPAQLLCSWAWSLVHTRASGGRSHMRSEPANHQALCQQERNKSATLGNFKESAADTAPQVTRCMSAYEARLACADWAALSITRHKQKSADIFSGILSSSVHHTRRSVDICIIYVPFRLITSTYMHAEAYLHCIPSVEDSLHWRHDLSQRHPMAGSGAAAAAAGGLCSAHRCW